MFMLREYIQSRTGRGRVRDLTFSQASQFLERLLTHPDEFGDWMVHRYSLIDSSRR